MCVQHRHPAHAAAHHRPRSNFAAEHWGALNPRNWRDMGGRGGSRISATLAFLLRSPIEAIVSPIEEKYFPTIFPFNLLLLGANPPVYDVVSCCKERSSYCNRLLRLAPDLKPTVALHHGGTTTLQFSELVTPSLSMSVPFQAHSTFSHLKPHDDWAWSAHITPHPPTFPKMSYQRRY